MSKPPLSRPPPADDPVPVAVTGTPTVSLAPGTAPIPVQVVAAASGELEIHADGSRADRPAPRQEDRRQWLVKQFTAAEVLAILAAVVTVIGAFSVGTVNVIVALRTTAVVAQTLEATHKVGAQVEQVHILTNSNLAALKSELAQALKEITSLREMVVDLRSERAKAAAATVGLGQQPERP